MRHEDIVNTIWDDLDHLTNDSVMLYIWSWTNLKCGMAGIYPIPRRRLMEGRLEGAALDAALAELEADDKLYYLDGVLWNKARVAHLSGFKKGCLSGVIVRSILKDLSAVDGGHPLLARFVERYSDHPSLGGLKTLSRPSPEGLSVGSISGGSDPLQRVQGQGQGHGEAVEDPFLRSVLAKLEEVAFVHGEPSPSIAKATDLIAEFGSRLDLEAQVAKFAAYWTGPRAKAAIPGGEVVWAFRVWLENDRPPPAPRVTKAPAGKPDYSRYDAVMEPAS